MHGPSFIDADIASLSKVRLLCDHTPPVLIVYTERPPHTRESREGATFPSLDGFYSWCPGVWFFDLGCVYTAISIPVAEALRCGYDIGPCYPVLPWGPPVLHLPLKGTLWCGWPPSYPQLGAGSTIADTSVVCVRNPVLQPKYRRTAFLRQ